MARKHPWMTLGLTSALWAHGALAEAPAEDWWVIGHKARVPWYVSANARFVRSTWAKQDRWKVPLDGTWVAAQSVVRALLDCIRFRRKLGPGVAEAALRRALETGKVTTDALQQRAEKLRILKPLRAMLRQLPAATGSEPSNGPPAASH